MLDADLEPVWAAEVGAELELAAPAGLRELLQAGRTYYWLVRSTGPEGAEAAPVRSSPALFRPQS